MWAFFVYRKCRRHTAGIYLVCYAAIRFGIEYLRGDPRAAVLGLSIGQAISLCMALVGATFIAIGACGRRRGPGDGNG